MVTSTQGCNKYVVIHPQSPVSSKTLSKFLIFIQLLSSDWNNLQMHKSANLYEEMLNSAIVFVLTQNEFAFFYIKVDLFDWKC